MNREGFRQLVAKGPLLVDGAMGTVLHEHGTSLEHAFDAVNQENPALVMQTHQKYINAGADIIETNSFGANRFKLAEHGLQDKVAAINDAAVKLARQVIAKAPRQVLLAGSVGPLGVRLAPLGRVSAVAARFAFAEQIEALITAEPAGVDLLIIETISDVIEMETAVAAARSISTTIPILASMAFTRDDRTLLGNAPDAVANRLAQLDVDAIGINCSVGPAQVLRLLSVMREIAPDIPLSAVPNAGWPEQTDSGRVIYPAVPAYFGNYARAFVEAGASLVGGCCGTTESHIAAMRHALDTPGESEIPKPTVQVMTWEEKTNALADRPTQLDINLSSGKFVVTAELSPPRGIATERLLAGARTLKEAGANCLNIADSPLARMRMSAWAAAFLVQQEVGLETILHFPTRGRNLLRIQGDLLAAHAIGIRNLFVTMGDPTRIGDFPEATDSYDIVPSGLIQLIKRQFSRGLDQSGQSIDQVTNFVVGCALNLAPKDTGREMRLLRKKIRNGADFAVTQPVFDPATAWAFVSAYESTYGEPIIPIIAGVKPLYNSRNAEFLHHEVPGIYIPHVLRDRMKSARRPQQEGVAIAQEILQEVRSFVSGVYMMPAFGRYDLVADVIDILS